MLQNNYSGLEGELLKFGNLIKGYQKRYFVINKEKSELNYYLSGNLRHREPKGIIKLKDAVILSSDEDDISFTIHAFDNKKHQIIYLKTRNKTDRIEWINELKNNINKPIAQNQSNKNLSANECCICMDTAKQVVVTLCGHLFCKKCIHQWIEMKPGNQNCPVCNKSINKQKIVRVYGVDEKVDPNESFSNYDQNLVTNDLENTNSIQNFIIEQQINYLQPFTNTFKPIVDLILYIVHISKIMSSLLWYLTVLLVVGFLLTWTIKKMFFFNFSRFGNILVGILIGSIFYALQKRSIQNNN